MPNWQITYIWFVELMKIMNIISKDRHLPKNLVRDAVMENIKHTDHRYKGF